MERYLRIAPAFPVLIALVSIESGAVCDAAEEPPEPTRDDYRVLRRDVEKSTPSGRPMYCSYTLGRGVNAAENETSTLN